MARLQCSITLRSGEKAPQKVIKFPDQRWSTKGAHRFLHACSSLFHTLAHSFQLFSPPLFLSKHVSRSRRQKCSGRCDRQGQRGQSTLACSQPSRTAAAAIDRFQAQPALLQTSVTSVSAVRPVLTRMSSSVLSVCLSVCLSICLPVCLSTVGYET